uniref:Secreted protein n=1 Tax=Schistosoma curassoni TaxID=6186 RepID=A0A183JRC1_9TREM
MVVSVVTNEGEVVLFAVALIPLNVFSCDTGQIFVSFDTLIFLISGKFRSSFSCFIIVVFK